jgi:hypothetical protein
LLGYAATLSAIATANYGFSFSIAHQALATAAELSKPSLIAIQFKMRLKQQE